MNALRSKPSALNIRQAFLLGMLALALAMTGFAHRAAIPNPSQSLPEAAYSVLPDGSIASVCLSGEADDSHNGHGGACEFCRIAQSSHSLDGIPDLDFQPAIRAIHPPVTGSIVLHAAVLDSNPARAPPPAA